MKYNVKKRIRHNKTREEQGIESKRFCPDLGKIPLKAVQIQDEGEAYVLIDITHMAKLEREKEILLMRIRNTITVIIILWCIFWIQYYMA